MHWWEVKIIDHKAEESRVTPALRNAVFLRDGWQCRYCGEDELNSLTVHHVVFRSQGGVHSVDNLVTLCGVCHMRIHMRTLYVRSIDGHWYFRDVLTPKEDYWYAPKSFAVDHIRLRRYVGRNLARWRSTWERSSILERYRSVQQSHDGPRISQG